MSLPIISSPLEILANGATITNVGSSTVYYRDEFPVTSTVNDGSIAAGSSANLDGAQWLATASGQQSAVAIQPRTSLPGGVVILPLEGAAAGQSIDAVSGLPISVIKNSPATSQLVQPASSGVTPLVLRGHASQGVTDLMDLQRSDGYLLGRFAVEPTGSGGIGWLLDKPSALGTVAHGVEWLIDGTPKWLTGMDTGNVEMVLAYDFLAPGDIVRVGTGGKIIMGKAIGSPASFPATLTLRTSYDFGLIIEPIEGVSASGGIKITQKANTYGLQIFQADAGSNRRTTINLGSDATGFRLLTDIGINNSNDFAIYDLAAAAYRLKIDPGGVVGVGFLRDVGLSGPYLQLTSSQVQFRSTGNTHLMNFGDSGMQWNSATLEQTTVGAAGGASALPATPTKYLKVLDSNGVTLVIPAYAAS